MSTCTFCSGDPDRYVFEVGQVLWHTHVREDYNCLSCPHINDDARCALGKRAVVIGKQWQDGQTVDCGDYSQFHYTAEWLDAGIECHNVNWMRANPCPTAVAASKAWIRDLNARTTVLDRVRRAYGLGGDCELSANELLLKLHKDGVLKVDA